MPTAHKELGIAHNPELAEQLDNSLRACIKEGVAAQIMIGIFDYYLIPLAIFLKANTIEIGLLISIPQLLSSLSQIFAIKSVELAGSRKRLLTVGVGLQAIFLVPLPFLVLTHLPNQFILLMIFVIIFRVIGSLLGPAWGSIVSDYLPEHRRGKYFGRRAQIVSISGVIAMSAFGCFLSFMNKISEAWGLFCVFLAAALCRFISYIYMNRLIELPHEPSKEDTFTFWMFVSRLKSSNFVRFVMFVASVTFATQLCASYFSVYMLKELHFGYLSYMAVSMASVIAGLLSFPVWGRHADFVGNAKVLKLTSLLVPLIPLMWMFNTHPLVLMAIEMFSGFVWGGFNLCTTNYIFDAVSPAKRVQCLCYFNLINGGALFAGASLGGVLALYIPPIYGSRLITLFFISAAMRLLAHFILSHHFEEVRPAVKKVRSIRLFTSVLGVRPLIGRNMEWGVFPPEKKLL